MIDKTDTSKRPLSSSPEKYFANLPTKECAYEIWDRIESYYNEMRRTGRLALYRNAYMNFYMGWIMRASMYKSGEMGELTRSFWNHHRNILLHIKVKTTQNKMAFKAQVLNSNAKSAEIVEFANGLADRYTQAEEYDLDSKGKQAVEDCLVFGESSVVGLWNRFKGRPVVQDPNTGFVYRDGDMDYFNVTPIDQIINTTHQDRNMVQWRCVRRWVNKYDWAAMYPKFHDEVVNLSDTESTYGTKLVTLIHHDSETIPVFYFFHEPTPAVPKGRLLVMADPTTVFEDGPLDKGEGQNGYDHIPVYDMIITTMQGSPYGYTVGFDLIPIQQMFNELLCAVSSNNINFATQLVMGPKGANIKYQNLATGMTYLEYDPKMANAKPEALNLLHSAPESYQLMDKCVQAMEVIGGLSAMDRGQPDETVTSGQYAALVTVQSVIFNSGAQKAYARLTERIMTGTIKTIKKNMIGTKVVSIVGAASEPYLKEFTQADLNDIDSMSVELTNPMLQTPAGKMQMADNLMKTGLIKDAKQYIGVYTDGDLNQVYHRQETQLKLVKQENEAIMKGQTPQILATDDHVMHILEHTGPLDTIEARMNPDLPYVVAGLSHIQQHLTALATLNPILAGIIGDPSLPPGMPTQIQMPPPPPGGPLPPPPGGASGPAQPQGRSGQPSPPAQTLPETGVPGPQPVGAPA